MRLSTCIPLLGFLLFITVPGQIFGVCGGSVPMMHGLDSYFTCSNDRGPVSAFAYVAVPYDSRTPDTVNTGTESIAINAGAGRVQIQTDWGAGGIVGCPQDANGNHRVLISVQGNDGLGVLVSISGADPSVGYLVETAHPFDAASGTWFPVPCTDSNSRPTIVSDDGTTLLVHVDAPHIVSDCDPGSVGMAALGDTCPDSFGPQLAAAAVAGLYTSTQPCSTHPDVVRSAWTRLDIPPDQINTTAFPYTLPTDPSLCLYIGTTISIAGAEGASIVGFTSLPGGACRDDDRDGVSTCQGDCDDHNAAVYPGHVEICDGLDNDCNGLKDENLPLETCGVGACRVTVPSCVGGVPQSCVPAPPSPETCNGIDDDCNGIVDDRDLDGDGYSACGPDCNDGNPSIHPGAKEICNGIDDNCNGLVDDDALGLDTDGDGVHNACDNCRTAYNPSQADDDRDGVGNSCDNCMFVPNPNQADLDGDQRGDACDNCPSEYNPLQDDTDGDKLGDVCDNCPFDPNPDQHDLDNDFQGDVCDLDDGFILVTVPDFFEVDWQREAAFDSFNVYRGDLDVLKSSGVYTQDPALVPQAEKTCGLGSDFLFDAPSDLPLGKAVFYLVSGVRAGIEGSLGQTGSGVERPNDNPCP